MIEIQAIRPIETPTLVRTGGFRVCYGGQGILWVTWERGFKWHKAMFPLTKQETTQPYLQAEGYFIKRGCVHYKQHSKDQH